MWGARGPTAVARAVRRSLTAASVILGLGVLIGACVVGERPSAQHLDCNDGVCRCTVGFGNCDGLPSNGCEAVLDVDPRNCGTCGTRCGNGTCEAGQCACNEGFVDCNADPADGCEAQLRVDPLHCGECAHSCLGGECRASACAPFLLAELGTYIFTLAANTADVFYCDGSSGVIYRVPKATGEVVELVLDQNCFEMAASETHLFWSVIENGEELIRAIPTAGGTAKTIAVTRGIGGFAPSGDAIVWTQYDPIGLVYELLTTTTLGATTAVGQSPDPIGDVVAVGNRVYWVEEPTDATSIKTAPISGGVAATLITTDLLFVKEILVVDDMLYWFQTDAEGAEATIRRVRSSGGAEEELYARNREVEHLLGDATGLYWTEDQGDRWMHAPRDGGQVETLAEFQDITLPVLGPDSLYWIDFPSHLFSLAK